MRRWAILALAASGCLASPPMRARLGGAYFPSAVRMGSDMPRETHGVATAAIGVHVASAAELPYDLGAGAMTDFWRGGYYLEGALLTRHRPWLRVGVTGAGEVWTANAHGTGARLGVTAEWTSPTTRRARTVTEKCVTHWDAWSGSRAIGVYVDVGYRWMDDEGDAASINFGLSARWPAYAGAASPVGGGGSSCE